GGTRTTPVGHDPRVDAVVLEPVDDVVRQQRRFARRVHAHLAQHLPHDHLDVLVVDRYALRPVDLLHLFDEVQLHRFRPHNPQDVLGIAGTFGELLAGVHRIPVFDAQARCGGNRVLPFLLLFVDDRNAVAPVDLDAAADAGNDIPLEYLGSFVLRLLPARARLRLLRRFRAIGLGLRGQLADRLSGDDADGLAHCHERSARRTAAVAVLADAALRLTCQRRAHVDALHAELLDARGFRVVDLLVEADEQLPGLRVIEV